MESAMFAGLLTHPVAVGILLCLAFVSVTMCGTAMPKHLSKQRLFCALGGVALAAVAAAAISAYATPEEARMFGVAEENRWSAIWNQFVVLAVLGVYLGVAGASLVGVPLAAFLARRELATAPRFLLVSAIISLVLAVPLSLIGRAPNGLIVAAYLVGSHVWLATGFVLGARLPWRIL